MEYKFGKTLGKWITGTKVVTINYQSPTLGGIIKRTFARFIPLDDWFTLLSGKSIHERISKTICIESRGGKEND